MTTSDPFLSNPAVSGLAGPSYAELLVMRDNPDQTRNGFHVHMVQDADGVWRISGM